MKRKWLVIALAATAFKSQLALALGLGDIELESYLNEPLNARIEILNTEGLLPTQILVKLASDKDFERVGIERNFFLTGLNFQVVVDSGGESYVAVTTREPVREPFLDFVVETKWPSGRLLREYTLLLDPPVFDDGIVISASEVINRGSRTQAEGPRSSVRTANSSGAQVVEERIAERPQAGQNYRVKPNETLWEIALEAKLPGSSVQATMLEIQRQNPDAFINNNINLLKAGRVVYLPTELDASLSDSEVVLANIRRQNQDWRAGRVSQPAAKLRIAADSVDQSSESASAVASKNRSEPNSSEAGFTVSDDRLAQLQSQLASIEEQLAVMQAIIETKDEQIALLRDALASKNVTSDEDREPTTQAPKQSSAGGAGEPVDTETPATVVNLAEPEVKTVPQVTTQQPPEKSGLSISMIAGGVGIAALLAALGLYWQRRRSSVLADDPEAGHLANELDEDVFAGVNLSDSGLEIDHDSNDEGLPSHVADSFKGSTAAADEYASDMDIEDALAEADIYIAYGRINQAVDLLQSSLEKSPGADECRLKLLEVLVDAGREDDARKTYQGVLDNCSRDVVVRADELMMRAGFIEQEHTSGNDEVFDLGADSSMFGPFGDALDSLLDEGDLKASKATSKVTDAVDDAGSTTRKGAELEAPSVGMAEDSVASLTDFDLSQFEEDSTEVSPDAALGGVGQDVVANDEGPDEVDAFFDQLQAQQQERLREEREEEMRAREKELAAREAVKKGDALDDIGFDDDTGAIEAEATDELLEDFDLSHLLEEDSPAPETETTGDQESGDLAEVDFSGMDLESGPADMSDDIDLSDFALVEEDSDDTLAEELFELEPSPSESQLENDDIFVAEGEDAPAAKLDLARAYIDMEDFESARSILEDVAETGNEAQRREADALLTTLL